MSNQSIFSNEGMPRRRYQRIGHLREQNGMWRLQYRVDHIDDAGNVTRKTIQKTIAYAKGAKAVSKREAGRIAREDYLDALDKFSTRPGSMMSVASFVETFFLPEHVPDLKPQSQQRLEGIIRNHILPEIGDKSLRDVDHTDVAQLIHRQRVTLGNSGQSAKHVKNAVSSIFRLARAKGYYTGQLPGEDIKVRVEAKKRGSLTWDQVQAIIHQIPAAINGLEKRKSAQAGKYVRGVDHPGNKGKPELYRALILFLAMTGARVNEALALKWTSIQNGIVTINSTVTRAAKRFRGGEDTHSPKSDLSVRQIPLPSCLDKEMQSLPRTSEYVFPSRTGRPLDSGNVLLRIFKPAAELAAEAAKARGESFPENVSFHWLRHTCATWMDEVGLTESERRLILGHSSAAMTRRYTHPEAERIRKKMEQLVTPGKSKLDQGEKAPPARGELTIPQNSGD